MIALNQMNRHIATAVMILRGYFSGERNTLHWKGKHSRISECVFLFPIQPIAIYIYIYIHLCGSNLLITPCEIFCLKW